MAAKALAHVILGGVVASLQGGNAAAGAAGGASGELIAGSIIQALYPGKTASGLSEEEKQTVSTLATIASGIAGGLAGDSTAGAAAGAQAGKNAVENNGLSYDEDERDKATGNRPVKIIPVNPLNPGIVDENGDQLKGGGGVAQGGKSTSKIDSVIKETISGKKNFTSSTTLTANEALAAGLKFLGPNYKEIGKPGSGVYHSADGTREFRIDSGSIGGAHAPGVPHVHFGVKNPDTGKYISNNHVPFKD